MVIDETTLLKMMNKAYKSGGYHIAVGDKPYGSCFMIANYGYSWGVVIERMHVPWSVLGLIVKHIGKIPEADEAYRVHKDDVQDEVFEVAAKPLLSMIDKAKAGVLPALKRTNLVFADRNVWQRSNDLDIVMFNPDYEDIAVLKETQAQMVDNCLYARGQHSQVFICRVAPGKHEEELVKHLGKIHWT